MDAAQRVLFFVQFVPVVILIVLLGCALEAPRDYKERTTYQLRQEEIKAEYQFDMIYLGLRTVYLVKFEGHEYLTRGMNSNLIHTESCPGDHNE